MTSWADIAGDDRGAEYGARFDRLAAAGHDVHGEASFCARRAPAGGRVLDAGCGTGRVAIRLVGLGFECVGVDADADMLAEARRRAPSQRWVEADLAAWRADEPFDVVVAAGNVVPLVDRGTEAAVVTNLAASLRPGGLLIAGFGLDAAHLPLPAAPFGLDEYDAWCTGAGLDLVERFATWDEAAFDDGGYAVSVHRRAAITA
ncbi:MAG: class I SAM-dependent methyltransferase [Jatrophihabitans sp.]|uniref:class I SAM-dependent methyltransferase n=1 Tax=Jatrophihabitans sp. TaxID=1932789 RepID=UPI003F7D277C